MTDRDEQLEAQLRARRLPGLSDEARHRLLADLASVATDNAYPSAANHAATPSFSNWRWIMRHPVSSAVAAAIFVLAVVGVGLWFSGGGATPALADYLQPLLDANTVKYKMIMEMTSLPAGMTGLSAEEQEKRMKPQTSEVMELGFHRRRTEVPGKRVEIWDGNQRKQLVLYPTTKRATLYDHSQESEDKSAQEEEDQGSASPRRPEEPGTVTLFRSLLLDTVHKPGAQRESLGEKEIDGRRVVGFRLSARGVVIDVWGDPKTRLPVRIESTMALAPHLKITQSDFEFNVPMDESLFSVEPPAGYEVTVKGRQPRDKSPETEKDLTEIFRYYGQWSGGRFPDVLDWQWIDEVLSEARRLDAGLTNKPQAEREKQFDDGCQKLGRAMMFMLHLPKDSDWHYGGRGVSIGAADTPVFWYRPKDATKYRVIYADLSVREAETPPSVPTVPITQMEKDLIDMFRQHAESRGDRFPDTLLFPDFARKCLQYLPTVDLSAEQQQELLEARVKLQRGAIFIGLLPKDADWHYAGKHVQLGMADRPIFWYRPNNKTYRVVYADLSVREADAPPSMPVALPEPGRPQGDCTITVTVVAEATGKPVPNARVWLFYPTTSHAMFVNTDSAGTHIFENMSTGPYSLRTINTAGYQDAHYDPEHKGDSWPTFSLKDGEQRSDIVLKVKPACRISGRVVDENGNLPEDANQLAVRAWFKADHREGYQNKYAAVNRSDCSYVIDGLSEKPAYVTVENERAAKEGHGLPPIYYPGTFSRSEAKLVTFENGRSVENVNITRRKEGGLAIAGTVRDEAGKPVPEAFVVVHPRDMRGGLLATAYTDLQGHYQIQGLGEGEFQVHVDAVHRGLVRTRMPIRLDKTSKKTELSFTLHRGATISGKLVDENGRDWKVARNLVGYAIVDTSDRDGYCSTNVDFRNKYRPRNSDGMARGWLYLGKGDYPDGEMIFPTKSSFIIQGMMPGHTTFQIESPPQKAAKILHAGRDILNSGIDTEPGQEIKDITIVIAKQ